MCGPQTCFVPSPDHFSESTWLGLTNFAGRLFLNADDSNVLFALNGSIASDFLLQLSSQQILRSAGHLQRCPGPKVQKCPKECSEFCFRPASSECPKSALSFSPLQAPHNTQKEPLGALRVRRAKGPLGALFRALSAQGPRHSCEWLAGL